MCVVEDSTAGCFIYATGFHTYHTVFADVSDTDTVFAADFIEFFQHFHRAQFFTVYCNGNACFKVQCDVFGYIGSIFGGYAQLQEMFVVRFVCGVFQFQTFVAQVPDVAVTAVRVVVACFERNAMCFQVSHFVFTTLHAPCIQTPGSDDFQFRCQCFDGQFKTYLVIAFACCAVADCCCAFFFGDFNQFLSDDGTSHGSTQEVFAFVNCVCFDAGVNRVCDEFFCQVSDVKFACACF